MQHRFFLFWHHLFISSYVLNVQNAREGSISLRLRLNLINMYQILKFSSQSMWNCRSLSVHVFAISGFFFGIIPTQSAGHLTWLFFLFFFLPPKGKHLLRLIFVGLMCFPAKFASNFENGILEIGGRISLVSDDGDNRL